MATNKKITDLTELTEVDLADDDVLAIVDISDGTTKKVRKSAFTSALAGVSTIAGSSPISVNQATGAVVVSLVGTIPIANGGTGATSATAAITALGGTTGPVSATDNAVARFDATTGKLLQNSTVTISDAGAITVGGNVVSDTDSTDDLGTTGVRWANTWTDAINGVTAPTAQYTSAEETKLAGIETAADVTDVTNVLLALVGQEVAATGFTGTLDGVLGGGQPAAATVTTLTASKLVPTGSSVAGNGVYLPASNSVGVSTAGVERLRIDASGNVGIGVGPLYKLHVSGDIYATGTVTAVGGVIGGIPSGTVMLFYQETVPTGWTRVTTAAIDKHALVVDTQTALGSFTGSKGGANAFATAFNGTIASGAHAGTAPAHVHQQTMRKDNTLVASVLYSEHDGNTNEQINGAAQSGTGTPAAVNTQSGGAGGTHTHVLDVDVAYVNMFLASKN